MYAHHVRNKLNWGHVKYQSYSLFASKSNYVLSFSNYDFDDWNKYDEMEFDTEDRIVKAKETHKMVELN